MDKDKAGGTGDPAIRVETRKMTPADEDFIFRVYCSTRDDLELIPGIDLQLKTALLQMQFRAHHLPLLQAYPDAEFSVILVDDEPAGRLYLLRRENAYHVLSISLLPEYRSRGVGARLLRDFMAEAEKARRPVRIQAAWHNAAARALYESLGFRVTEDTGLYFDMEWCPDGMD